MHNCCDPSENTPHSSSSQPSFPTFPDILYAVSQEEMTFFIDCNLVLRETNPQESSEFLKTYSSSTSCILLTLFFLLLMAGYDTLIRE